MARWTKTKLFNSFSRCTFRCFRWRHWQRTDQRLSSLDTCALFTTDVITVITVLLLLYGKRLWTDWERKCRLTAKLRSNRLQRSWYSPWIFFLLRFNARTAGWWSARCSSADLISCSNQYHMTTLIVTLVSLWSGGQNVQNGWYRQVRLFVQGEHVGKLCNKLLNRSRWWCILLVLTETIT